MIRRLVFTLCLLMASLALSAADRSAREAVEALEAYAVYKMAQYPEAYRRFLALARKNNVQGMLNVANMLQAGLGVRRDEAAALDWYQKAATEGSAIGMYYTGRAYQQGRGTVANPDLARRWLEKAANAGSSEAQLALGKLLLRGDESRAGLDWIARAAAGGDVIAQRYLASLEQQDAAAPGVAAADRALIDAAWQSVDRSLRHGNAPGIVYYLAHHARISIRLPEAQNWLRLDRQGLRDFWQQSFERAQRVSLRRGELSYRAERDRIRVVSVLDENLEFADRSEHLKLEESALVRIRDDRVVVEELSLVITRL